MVSASYLLMTMGLDVITAISGFILLVVESLRNDMKVLFLLRSSSTGIAKMTRK